MNVPRSNTRVVTQPQPSDPLALAPYFSHYMFYISFMGRSPQNPVRKQKRKKEAKRGRGRAGGGVEERGVEGGREGLKENLSFPHVGRENSGPKLHTHRCAHPSPWNLGSLSHQLQGTVVPSTCSYRQHGRRIILTRLINMRWTESAWLFTAPRYLPGSPKTEIPTTESSVLLGGVIQLSIDKDTKIPKLPETGRPQIIAHGPSLVHFLLSQTKSYRDTAMHTQFPITYALSSYKGGVDSL